MNIYRCLNDITTYIDNNLEEKINYNTLAKMMGVNTYTMQRIFSLITGVSLSEYIRKRRLSNAAFDLYNTKTKIIDIAIKYQYDNATSFSRAFEKFHGIKPSQIRKDISKLKNFPKMVFNEAYQAKESMEYSIIEKNEIILYGIGIDVDNKSIGKKAPKLFEDTEKKYKDIYGHIKYGMVTYKDSERDFCDKYYVLYDKEIKDFEKITIPKSRWLVLKINSHDARDIQEMSQKFYYDFLPSCKYNLREIPELEKYQEDTTEFLVPIY